MRHSSAIQSEGIWIYTILVDDLRVWTFTMAGRTSFTRTSDEDDHCMKEHERMLG